jgi:hypothetical protein
VHGAVANPKTEAHLGGRHLEVESVHAAPVVHLEAGEVVRNHLVIHVVRSGLIGIVEEAVEVRLLLVVHESWTRSILRVAELIVLGEVVGEVIGGD